MFRNKKYLIIGGITTILVLLVGYFAYISFDRSGKLELKIHTVPNDAKVLINEKQYSAGSIWLKPGQYTVVTSKDGFITSTVKFDTDTQREALTIGLLPESDEAQKWYTSNINQYKKLDVLSDEISDQNIEESMSAHPELSRLPYKSMLYSINYTIESDLVTLVVDSDSGHLNSAIKKLYELGYDPADYEIKFNNYSNPFKEKVND